MAETIRIIWMLLVLLIEITCKMVTCQGIVAENAAIKKI
jgi:hypothetical protein